MYSPVSGEVPNVWEADCCIRPPSMQYWTSGNGEPNGLDEHCSRMSVDPEGWRSTRCQRNEHIICETDRGNCTYETLHNTTITTLPNASRDHVDDVSTCWSLCLQLRHNGEECVAAVLEEKTLCKLYVGRRLLEENQVQTSPCPDSVVMLRRCFEARISQEYFPGFDFTDASAYPHPASATCPEVYNATTEAATTETTAAASGTQSASPKDPKPTLCLCSCLNGYISGSLHPVNLTAIAKNQTSKYRRAKTSVWTGQTSHAIVGTPWAVACVLVFCCIALCDLNPRKWRPDECRRAWENKVVPNP